MDELPLTSTDPRYAWLPALLPADAASLSPPDVEIGHPSELSGTARVAFSPFVAERPEIDPLRAVRGVKRIARSLGAQSRAARWSATLERLGYPETEVVVWDPEGEVGSRGFPLGAVAVGRKSPSDTLLQRLVGPALTERPLLREGAAVGLTATEVWRISVGASRMVDGQVATLAGLRETGFSSPLVPWTRDHGVTGLGHWSREPRLAGSTPARLDEDLLDACVEFLAQLSAVPALPANGSAPPAALAELRIGVPANLPRSFAHGDFHIGNLLVANRELSGVIDWDAAAGRPALNDYLHLIATDDYLRHRRNLGPTIVEFLLPWARAGGDERARGLLSRAGVEATPELLENLVAAYWLEFVGGEIAKSEDRLKRPRWRRENVDLVAKALA